MSVRTRALSMSALTMCVFVASMLSQPVRGQGGGARGRVTITASPADRRAWSSRVDSMLRTGGLRVRRRVQDTLLAGRTHERADQFYRGVRVFGADVSRQLRNGATESVFGTIYDGIDIDSSPAIDA